MEFKYRLSFDESIAMVNMVFEMVFHKNTDSGVITYVPELYDYALRLAAIRFYGGYDLSEDNDENYEAAMDIHIQDTGIDMSQFQGIEKAILEKIDMKKAQINQSNIAVVSQFDELVPVVKTMIEGLSEKFSEIDTHRLNQLLKEQGLF